MSNEKDALQRTLLAHKGTDRGLELATSLGLDVANYASAKLLHLAILKSDKWSNQRSPHGLMVDCLYLSANKNGIKISARKMRELTLKIFDVGTQPIPSVWKDSFKDLIEEYL
jgi:hypothetical protein|tara:strand:- start:394 stop:732 length:339 start_codon:yes stop_codon:yes gene_type:complete